MIKLFSSSGFHTFYCLHLFWDSDCLSLSAVNALTIFEMIHFVVLFFFLTLTKKEIKLFKTVVTRVKLWTLNLHPCMFTSNVYKSSPLVIHFNLWVIQTFHKISQHIWVVLELKWLKCIKFVINVSNKTFIIYLLKVSMRFEIFLF